jgi:AraC family transcriptional regulator
MKKSTYEKRAKIANDVMNYIYKYIDTNINIDDLSLELILVSFIFIEFLKRSLEKIFMKVLSQYDLKKLQTY